MRAGYAHRICDTNFSTADNFYSFVGACNQSNLIKKAAPQWVDLMISQKVDGVLLVPA